MTCKIDITGRRFGKLVAIRPIRTKNHRSYWEFICDCGTMTITTSHGVRNGLVKSCGCFRREYRKLPGHATKINKSFKQYQFDAMKRGFSFDLTIDDFNKIVTQDCNYCGVAPLPISGVDRVNPLLGYFLSNCVPCCRQCNQAKWNYDKNEFLHWIDRIYVFQHKR